MQLDELVIAIIVAILYISGAILISISAFMVTTPLGFLVSGVLTVIPAVILYIEANTAETIKGGGK